MSLIEAAPAAPRRVYKSTGRVTLSDLVKLVGVTKVIVSHVLDTPELISDDTLERACEAVRQTGYMPDLMTNSLASNRNRLIVALIPMIADSVFQETAAALTTELTAAGYQLLTGQSGYDESREDTLLDATVGRRPAGIVLTGMVHSVSVRQKLQVTGVLVVEIWGTTRDPLGILVDFLHRKVGQAAARYLEQRGAKYPAIITSNDRRARACAQVFVKAFGLEAYTPVMAAESPAGLGDGRRVLGTLLEQHSDTDAISCGADILVLGVLMEAEHRGVAMPAQLRVVDHGDQMFVKDTTPTLTAIRIDGTGIGKLAVTLLINHIEHGDEKRCMVDVGFTLIEYDSV